VAAGGEITLAYDNSVANSAKLTLATNGSITFAGASSKLNINGATPIVLSGGSFTNVGANLEFAPGATAVTATLTGATLTHLTLGEGAEIAIPAAAQTPGFVLDKVFLDLSENGTVTIEEAGILVLGTESAKAGIITAYGSSGNVIVGGGSSSNEVTTDVSVTPFNGNGSTDYTTVVTTASGITKKAGTITAGAAPENNTIDAGDTFTAASSAITVGHTT
jgi:hypothetical protein